MGFIGYAPGNLMMQKSPCMAGGMGWSMALGLLNEQEPLFDNQIW